jgi:hypothetical protein
MSGHHLGPTAAGTSGGRDVRSPVFFSHTHLHHEPYSSAASSATVLSPPSSPATAATTLIVEGFHDAASLKAVATAADSEMMLEDGDDFGEPAYDGSSDDDDDDGLLSDDSNDNAGRLRVQRWQMGSRTDRDTDTATLTVTASVSRLCHRQLRRVSIWRSDVALAAPPGPAHDAALELDCSGTFAPFPLAFPIANTALPHVEARRQPHTQRHGGRKRTRTEHDTVCTVRCYGHWPSG